MITSNTRPTGRGAQVESSTGGQPQALECDIRVFRSHTATDQDNEEGKEDETKVGDSELEYEVML